MSEKLRVRRAAVLGAGVMGAQIAAHLTNAGVDTVLFDLPAKEGNPDGIVAKAIANLAILRGMLGRAGAGLLPLGYVGSIADFTDVEGFRAIDASSCARSMATSMTLSCGTTSLMSPKCAARAAVRRDALAEHVQLKQRPDRDVEGGIHREVPPGGAETLGHVGKAGVVRAPGGEPRLGRLRPVRLPGCRGRPLDVAGHARPVAERRRAHLGRLMLFGQDRPQRVEPAGHGARSTSRTGLSDRSRREVRVRPSRSRGTG